MTIEVLNADAQWPSLSPSAEYPRLNGHDPQWLSAVCRGLSQKPLVLVHKNGEDKVDGILPLALVKSWLFGKFLVSMPYVNTGGTWANDANAATQLISHACELADQHQVRYLELRHEKPVEHAKLNATRTDKVHMRLTLPDSEELLDRSFKSKLRSQVKKAGEYDLAIEWGGHQLVDDFYKVFAVNMRDLGTPVFPKRLFVEILNRFPTAAELCVVRKGGKAIAVGMLIHLRGITEVPSASCLREFNFTGANMWMYRQMLGRAISKGSQTFDFGRSSVETGTYRFKAQWGALPEAATWQYYVRRGSAEAMRPDGAGNQRLIKIWQRLPVGLTRIIGPVIVRGIP